MVSDDKLVAVNAAVAEYGQAKFDEGVASVQPAPVDTTSDENGMLTQEQAAQMVAAEKAKTQAALDQLADLQAKYSIDESQLAAIRAALASTIGATAPSETTAPAEGSTDVQP